MKLERLLERISVASRWGHREDNKKGEAVRTHAERRTMPFHLIL